MFLTNWITKPFLDSLKLYWSLMKLMVPVMIGVQLAVTMGLIPYINMIFEPIMSMIGLPPEAGIIWTTAMLVNIYAGLVALAALLPQTPMSVAELSILGAMILIAHSLPIEQRIVQKSGPSLIATTALRVVCAIVYGAILNLIYSAYNLFQEEASIGWLSGIEHKEGWLNWAYDSALQLFSIFWIIWGLIMVLKIFEVLKINALIAKALSPVLGWLGISNHAIPLTMFGVVLGLGYGGALIMREAQKGEMSSKDIFLSLSFMCLFHSAIEDTLLILSLGTDVFGILVGRFIMSFIVIFMISRLLNILPENMFERYLFKQPKAA